MKVISFSLWGDDPKYVVGALRNAALAPTIYPGWRCRFYCGASVPRSCLDHLDGLGHVDVVRMNEPGDWTGMFWRFRPAAEPLVEVAIFRDCDSRLNPREGAAVNAWLSSGRDVHVMRDHPWHSVPILGGMWGVRGGLPADVTGQITRRSHGNYWQVDQHFLAEVVAPRVRDRWLAHDEIFDGVPFPTWRRWREFVGQPFDADDRPLVAGYTGIELRVRAAARRVRRLIQAS